MIKKIVTDIAFLRTKSEKVGFFESRGIIKDLEDTLKETKNGIGLSAIQIGVAKKVSILRLPNFKLNLINAEIIEKSEPIRFPGECCLSLPGLSIDTRRYNYIKLNNGKECKGIIAVCIQHEIAHWNGRLIIDDKWRRQR